jgi:hypothetical protein
MRTLVVGGLLMLLIIVAALGIAGTLGPKESDSQATPVIGASDSRDASPPIPDVVVKYRLGFAQVRLVEGDGVSVVTLNELASVTFQARHEPGVGTQAEWTTPHGEWLLTVLAGNDADTQIFIERSDTDPPRIAGGSSCTVVLTNASAAGFSGSASCDQTWWFDAYNLETGIDKQTPIPGLEPFSATIQFRASP